MRLGRQTTLATARFFEQRVQQIAQLALSAAEGNELLLLRPSRRVGGLADQIHLLCYGYDPANNRSVAVAASAVSEALRKVYGAGNIADELERP